MPKRAEFLILIYTRRIPLAVGEILQPLGSRLELGLFLCNKYLHSRKDVAHRRTRICADDSPAAAQA